MIHYDLICEKGHRFDGWFASSAAFDNQRAAKQLACPHCGSHSVDRALMAPNLRLAPRGQDHPPPARAEAQAEAREATKSDETPPPQSQPQHPVLSDGPMAELRAAAKAFRAAIEKHATDVGGRFPEEARKIHYGESEDRAIYGQASLDDVRDLVDEGIEVMPLPGRNADNN